MSDDYRAVQQKLDQQVAKLGKAMFTRGFWKGIRDLIFLAYFFLFVPFVSVPRQLFFTGGGYMAAPIIGLVIAIYGTFWLALETPTLAGDALFLVACILAAKSVTEILLAVRRQRGQPWGKRVEGGISLFSPLGIRGEAATFAVAALIGLVVWPSEFGGLVGPILVVGGIGGVITTFVVHLQIQNEIRKIRMRDYEMTVRAQLHNTVLGDEPGGDFQRVDLG